jgi:hypothetical protein
LRAFGAIPIDAGSREGRFDDALIAEHVLAADETPVNVLDRTRDDAAAVGASTYDIEKG